MLNDYELLNRIHKNTQMGLETLPLLSMRAELGRTALLVTHDIDEALYLSDRILVPESGTADA